MVIFFEISLPFHRGLHVFSSEVMVRVTCAWFAFGWLRVRFEEFSATAYDWSWRNWLK